MTVDTAPRRRLGDLDEGRLATAGFALLVVAAIPLLLWWGRDQWFFLDEWSFLAQRPLPSWDGLFENHNGHWVTIPLLVFRTNFELFGLSSYLPYQVWVVLAHLSIAVVGQVLMRRMGVRPWLAALCGVAFVFLGSGAGNILFAFQITLDGSVLAGLTQIVLADHDGRWQRRDTAGVFVAVLGLMTSAVAVPMVIGVGVFVLVRRGWRIAAGHTVPPGLVFAAWWAAFGGAEQSDVSAGRVVRFVFHMWRAVFEGIARTPVGAVVLFAVAVLGVTTAVAGWRRGGPTRPVAISAGLGAALLVFTAVTAINRSGFGDDIRAAASQGRYVHVGAALMVPVIGLGAQRMWELRRPLVLLPLVALAVGLPANIDDIRHRGAFTTGNEDLVLSIAHSPLLPQVQGAHQPVPFAEVEAAWLLAGARNGDIPEPDPDVAPEVHVNADALVALQPTATTAGACTPEPGRLVTTVDKGDRLVFGAPSTLVVVEEDVRATRGTYDAGDTVRVLAGPLDIVVRGAGDAAPAVCVD